MRGESSVRLFHTDFGNAKARFTHGTLSKLNPIIFVDANGQVICSYNDSIWVASNSRPYIWSDKNPKIASLLDECKAILFLILYHPHLPDLSISTLGNYYNGLKLLANACFRRNVTSVSTFFSDPSKSLEILAEIQSHAGRVVFLHTGPSLFAAMHLLGPEAVGFETVIGETHRQLRACLQKLNAESFQTPVIPWSIYKQFISSLIERIEFWKRALDDERAPQAFRLTIAQLSRRERAALVGISSAWLHDYGTPVNTIHVTNAVRKSFVAIQHTARIGMLTFTGCRTHEEQMFSPKCLSVDYHAKLTRDCRLKLTRLCCV